MTDMSQSQNSQSTSQASPAGGEQTGGTATSMPEAAVDTLTMPNSQAPTVTPPQPVQLPNVSAPLPQDPLTESSVLTQTNQQPETPKKQWSSLLLAGVAVLLGVALIVVGFFAYENYQLRQLSQNSRVLSALG